MKPTLKNCVARWCQSIDEHRDFADGLEILEVKRGIKTVYNGPIAGYNVPAYMADETVKFVARFGNKLKLFI